MVDHESFEYQFILAGHIDSLSRISLTAISISTEPITKGWGQVLCDESLFKTNKMTAGLLMTPTHFYCKMTTVTLWGFYSTTGHFKCFFHSY